MSIIMRGTDLKQVASAIRLLTAPLDAESPDSWRRAVNRCLAKALGADSAGFILPLGDGPLVYSEEHDPASLSRYPDMVPPSLDNGMSVFANAIRLGASTLEDVYDGRPELYLRSEYYNDYAGPNGAHDSLTAMVSLGGSDPRSLAGLQFWHGSAAGRKFGAREREILRLVLPALESGARQVLQWVGFRADLLHVLDRLGHAVLVSDTGGKLLHQTRALAEALAEEPEAAVLRGALHDLAAAYGTLLDHASPATALGALFAADRQVRTRRALYRLSGSLLSNPVGQGPPLVLIALIRLTPVACGPEELRHRYGLTPAECRLVPHLVSGRSSAEIAQHLFLSVHTVRRHIENILAKTGSSSRVELTSRVMK
jgi:DNA-binding CsgD family transcriptional regulator